MTNSLAARYHTAAHRLRERREAGQGSLEYLGMAMLAGVILAAIFGVINGSQVTTLVQDAWTKITGTK